MFLIHADFNLQVAEQLWVQPEGLITQEVLQAASHIAWDSAHAVQHLIPITLLMVISLHPRQQNHATQSDD